MIPIRDDNPQINIPYITYSLIALNILAWLLLQGYGTTPRIEASVCQFGLIPADLFTQFLSDAEHFCNAESPSGWYGLASSMFMHGSWMHLIGNMWFLWIFGDNVEDAMGSINYLIFYVLTGLCASAAQILADPDSSIPMVGASGAISGVMGAYLVLYPKVKVHIFIFFIVFFKIFRVPAIAMLGYWIFIDFIRGVSSLGAESEGGVAFWAHVGGFVAGAILVFVFKNDALLKKHPHYGW